MKFLAVTVAVLIAGSASGFSASSAFTQKLSIGSNINSKSSLNMVLEKPATKKISKLEQLKVNSISLVEPLKEVKLFMYISSYLKRRTAFSTSTTNDAVINMMKSFFPRLIDTCRRKERPCPFASGLLG
jgi:hypothetical protein